MDYEPLYREQRPVANARRPGRRSILWTMLTAIGLILVAGLLGPGFSAMGQEPTGAPVQLGQSAVSRLELIGGLSSSLGRVLGNVPEALAATSQRFTGGPSRVEPTPTLMLAW
jgi:hypothetical protein